MEIVLLKKTEELEKLLKELGLEQVYFLEDIALIKGDSPKEILAKLKEARKNKKLLIHQAGFKEDTLRFVLEKTGLRSTTAFADTVIKNQLTGQRIWSITTFATSKVFLKKGTPAIVKYHLIYNASSEIPHDQRLS